LDERDEDKQLVAIRERGQQSAGVETVVVHEEACRGRVGLKQSAAAYLVLLVILTYIVV
jgi:hypothetical protein